MSVVDKYRPVDPTPTTITPWAPALVGSWLVALLLLGFSADDLRRTATYDTSLPDSARVALEGLADLGEASGLAQLRRTLETYSAPLDDTARLWRAPLPTVPADEAPPPEPVEPDVPPGERWAAVAARDRVHRILLVGASSIQYAIGTELERVLTQDYADLVVDRKGKVSTGLTRPDVFDWPAEVSRRLESFRPDVVIGQFGGNDGQPIVAPDGTAHDPYTDGWEQEYTRRVRDLAARVSGADARLVLLGMPRMRSPAFDRKMRWLNEITERAVTGAGGTFVPTDDLSGGPDGAYRADVRFEGTSGRMRMDDGIHFTRLGGQYVAHHLAHRLEREMVLVPVSEGGVTPAVAHRLTVPSSVRGPTPALAFVPQDVPEEGLPVWYLLHGAFDDWTAWSEHAHDPLQQLASLHRMIVVLPDGEPFGYWMDSPVQPDHRLATWFRRDLVGHAERVLPADGSRAISGNSMGGHGALTLALAAPGRWAAATSMSGAVDLTRSGIQALPELLGPLETNRAAWEAHSAATMLLRGIPSHLPVLLSCGRTDRFWWEANLALHQRAEAAGVPHDWMPQDGGHTWDVWLEALPHHAAFVARAVHPPQATAPPLDPPAEAVP